MINQTKEGILIAEVNSFEESIERANLGDFKTKAIVKNLEEVKRGIELNEEFYVTREVIRIWVSALVGKFFVTFLVIGMFIATYYEKRN